MNKLNKSRNDLTAALTNIKQQVSEPNEYHQQAEAFLNTHGIKFRATLSNTKLPAWDDGDKGERNHYRVTLSRHYSDLLAVSVGQTERAKRQERATGKPSRLVFDFWGSINDARKNVHPCAYDVLACISGDASTPETFADFCGEFGYEQDSIKALQTFRRCSAFAKRLRAFFTAAELEALQEIR